MFFFSSRRRHTRSDRDWSSDVCSSDLKDALVADLVIRCTAAESLRRDFLKLPLAIHSGCVCRAGHRMGRLAASRHASVRKVFRGIAPDHFALLPGHAKNFCADSVDIDHRLRSQVADSRVEADLSAGRNHKQPIKPNRAADVTAQRYADTAYLGTDPF